MIIIAEAAATSFKYGARTDTHSHKYSPARPTSRHVRVSDVDSQPPHCPPHHVAYRRPTEPAR
eukprot:7276009-Prymnesium_polylepis.1